MATVAITPAAHPADPEASSDNLSVLTGTGAGNGFVIPYKDCYQIIFHNDSGSLATVTIKAAQPTEYSSHGITIPDDTFTIANGASKTWVPKSIFKDSNGDLVIEADQLIKAKAFTALTRS